jgi:ankyrin repeat protein
MLVHYIAALGFINTFKVLIEFNCDLNAQTDEGITPLQIAIALGLEVNNSKIDKKKRK